MQTIETKWGTFTLPMMQEIKRGYDQAVADNAEQFRACEHDWLTGFAKYLIEYAEGQGMSL